jgi:aspartate/methionine/tyrosine aminotransferase
MTFTQRTTHLKPEGAYQVLAYANQLEAARKEIIHFEIGQPDYPTLENVSRVGIVDGLNAIPGFSCQKPQGAFYVFPNIRGTGMSSTELANFILEEAGVALLPGNSFGKFGEGYLRLSYANSIVNIHKGLERIRRLVALSRPPTSGNRSPLVSLEERKE